jgi:polysaccharide deacetylase 2 family uncharacterized protein YibQ
MADQLDAPLGRGKQKKATGAGKRFDVFSLPLARIGFALLALIILGVTGRILLVDDPEGGRPTAEIGISTIADTNDVATEIRTPPPAEATDLTPSNAPNEQGIIAIGPDVPDAVPQASTGIAALSEFGVLPELIEETTVGTLPRTGNDGQTPFATYARASIIPDSSSNTPLIAVIVTGMGLSEGGTIDAIEKLPDNITLAFAPYGRSLLRTTSAARNGGHEILLEIPLEPFDYPENDPGPQTLLTGQPPRANLDRLFWLMARMGGYIGTINHMGARFTASAVDFNPIMEELALRGLGYVDDGSSNRSLAGNLANTNHVPFSRADIAIDASPSRASILSALEELEAKAVEKGQAIGIASALPVSIQTISDWAAKLEERGFMLVPVSTLMTTSK